MGHVRTKTVKKAAKLVIEKHYSKLTNDFHSNKRICSEVAIIPSKKLRNQVAGYVTHLMRRIESGPVRGISIKLQEEQRELRDSYIPEVSQLERNKAFDEETMKLLKHMGFGEAKWATANKQA